MISPLAYVSPDAKIGANVEIKPFAYIDSDVEIGDDCVIEPYVSILPGTRMGKNNHVYSHAVLGAEPQDFHYEPNTKSYLIIGDDNDIRENVVIARSIHKDGKAVIGNGNALMDKVHICHDVKLGNRCVLGINVSVAGDCVIEDCSIQSSGAVIQQRVRVGRYSLIQSGCRVQKDVPPYVILGGNPAGYHGVNAVVLKHVNVSERILRHIANTYRLVYTGNFSLEDAVHKIREQIPMSEEIEHIMSFIQASKHGIVRPVSPADM